MFEYVRRPVITYSGCDGEYYGHSLRCSSDAIKLSIRDNGQGFDVKIASNGKGLRNRIDRARVINALLVIDGQPR